MINPVLPPHRTIDITIISGWSIKNNKRKEELREEAFVHMYRFWIRAILGDYKSAKRIENAIFGSTDLGPQVKLKVTNNRLPDKDIRDVFRIGDKVSIRLTYATEQAATDIHPLLEKLTNLVAYLGGVGGKTGRDFGCFKVEGKSLDHEENQTAIMIIETLLKDVVKLLRHTFEAPQVPTITIAVDKTLSLTGQKDTQERYPFLLSVKAVALNKKSIKYGFTEIKNELNQVGGQKVETLKKVFQNKYHFSQLQFFGSFNPRYTSPITVSTLPNHEDMAILCMFQPSHKQQKVHTVENQKQVFNETCKSYER